MTQPYPHTPNDPVAPHAPTIHEPIPQRIHEPIPQEPIHPELPEEPKPAPEPIIEPPPGNRSGPAE
jgi:hypothetical protein